MEKFTELLSKYLPYLEDIRKKLYITAILFLGLFVAGFLSAGSVIRLFVYVFDIENVVIATTSPFQFADLSINIGLLCAMTIICPIIVFQIYMFVRKALTKKERRVFFSLIPLTLALFALGSTYGFFIMYYALIILAKLNTSLGIQNIWDIGMFLTQIVITAALLGLLFQFPIAMTYLIKMRIFDVSFLKKKRRIAMFIILLFTTLLPPTDGISLIAMALPLVALYEVTILVNSRINHSKKLLV